MVKNKRSPASKSSLLQVYAGKRNFTRSPEPVAAAADGASVTQHFVVHKHAASRLHYDLRLECQGVLRSWAIPKGPSLDPLENRLSVRVEDHPLRYRDFEDVIPAGNYGAWALPVPGIFETCPFEPFAIKWPHMVLPSRFIKPIHPKTAIASDEAAITKVIAAGWWGQPKVHGHRAQIHIPADGSACLVYNRQGQLHKETLSESIEAELRRLYAPAHGWNVVDAEWLKPTKKIFVFDFLKREGVVLDQLSFAERYECLPKLYLSPHISTLPVFKTVEQCLSYLSGRLPSFIEGLVFRAAFSPGFADNAIVRCRL